MDANTPPTDIGSKEGLRFKDLFRPAKEAPSYPVARADWHPSNIWATTPHFRVNHDDYDLVPLPLGESVEVGEVVAPQPVSVASVPKKVESKPTGRMHTQTIPDAPITELDLLMWVMLGVIHLSLEPVRKAYSRLSSEISELVEEIATRDAQIDVLNQRIAVLNTELNRTKSMVFAQRASQL